MAPQGEVGSRCPIHRCTLSSSRDERQDQRQVSAARQSDQSLTHVALWVLVSVPLSVCLSVHLTVCLKHIAQASFKFSVAKQNLKLILLPPLPNAGITGMRHHALWFSSFNNISQHYFKISQLQNNITLKEPRYKFKCHSLEDVASFQTGALRIRDRLQGELPTAWAWFGNYTTGWVEGTCMKSPFRKRNSSTSFLKLLILRS